MTGGGVGRPEQTLDWMRDGTRRLLADIGQLPDDALEAPTVLPGWDRRYLMSHVAANAEALRNLVHWARTGEERRMYASAAAREEGIKAGTTKSTAELRAWITESAAALDDDLDTLPDEAWDSTIVTAQGVTRTANEIPWMRVREVYVHAVDLNTGVGFGDLPAGFLVALCDDIALRRSVVGQTPALALTDAGTGRAWAVTRANGPETGSPETGSLAADGPVAVTAPLEDLTAWLAGRPVSGLTDAAGRPAPDLPAWL
jgi:maleylpyruvate isomerase